MDLDQSYTLSHGALKQKESEIQLLYKLIELYEEIVNFQLKERTSAVPKTLKALLSTLTELKSKLELTKTDEESKEKSRRQHQLNALNDRLSLRMSIPDFPIEHSKSIKASQVNKKQNILTAGFGKLFGKGNMTPKRNTTLMDVKEVSSFVESHQSPIQNNIQSFSGQNQLINQQQDIKTRSIPPLLPKTQSIDQESASSSLDKVNPILENKIPSTSSDSLVLNTPQGNRNLAQQSEFSQSMQMLEKQVKELIKPTKHDYLEQFKQRSSERLAKLHAATPYSISTKSDMTNSQTLYENSSRNSSDFSAQLSNLNLKEDKQYQKSDDTIGKIKESIKDKNEPMDTKNNKVLDMFASKNTRNALLEKAYGIEGNGMGNKKETKMKMQPIMHTKKQIKSRRPTDDTYISFFFL